LSRIEGLKRLFERRPHDVWRAVKAWDDTPNATTAWAWFAEFCGVWEVEDLNNPLALARAEGRREAFFALWDLVSTRGDAVLELQKRASREGGEG